MNERHKTLNKGREMFMAYWMAAKKAKAALRHAVARPNVTGRHRERVVQRQACMYWFAHSGAAFRFHVLIFIPSCFASFAYK